MSEKKIMIVRNATRRTIPLEGTGAVPSLTIHPHGRAALGPEYHEHYQFLSLRKKRMLVVIKEEIVKAPTPAASPKPPKGPEKAPEEKSSSPPRHRSKKSKAQKRTSEEESPKVPENADGA
jgi:hypothetical protein